MNKREIKFKFEGTLLIDVDQVPLFKESFPKENWDIDDFNDEDFDGEAQEVSVQMCMGDIINHKGEITHVECEPIIDETYKR